MTVMLPDGRLYGKTLLVCVGAQKSGTTWLHANLRRHPEVYLPPLKEMHWFDASYPKQTERLERYMTRAKRAMTALRIDSPPNAFDEVSAMLDYFQLLGGGLTLTDFFARHVRPGHRVFGDFTPAYAEMDIDALIRMRDAWPDTRVVFLMREPVARLVSAARMNGRQLGRRATDTDVLAKLNNPRDVAYSRYDLLIERLLSVFGEGRVYTTFYETMFRPQFSTHLCRWLGISDMPFNNEERVNFAADPYTVEGPGLQAAREILKPVYDYCADRFGDAVPAEWQQTG
ncbi:sulfotransferase [Methylorubrum sp. SB2]|uniref:sulfotransferase family protein n=1 Tax=Methylorubrum subtropicum TaxID=3138812 RepID=UPI00313BE8AF